MGTFAEEARNKRIDDMLKTQELINKHSRAFKCKEGTIECPSCHGNLHYTISSYNGHKAVICETPNCQHWME